jgi:thioredoxin 1
MNFEEIINAKQPTLIDFFATWCGPCKAMTPILQETKKALGDKVQIIKIDVDKNPSLASKLQVQGVPTFVLYKAGKMLWRRSGMIPKPELVRLIEEASK